MFINLHNHFTGSFSDSALKIEEGVKKAKLIGQNAIAMTEHGEMPFVYEFFDECIKYGIKPIFGVEIYFVENAQKSIQDRNPSRYHLVLLAKNETGYKNLVSMVSESWIKNNYYEKRGLVDWELLAKYKNGIIAMTACFFNIVSQTYIKKSKEEAEAIFLKYKNIFGKDFYAEIAKHGIIDEEISNKALIELSSKHGVKPVATNDTHYLNIDDWLAHDIIIKTRFEKISAFKADSQHFWLKSESEMLEAGHCAEFLRNTAEVAEKCEFSPSNMDIEKYADESAEDALANGNAAYISQIERITSEQANFYCGKILGENHTDAGYYSGRITGIPRRHKCDFAKIAYLKDIKEKIPLKIISGKPVTQFTEESCKRAGANIRAVLKNSIADKLREISFTLKNILK
ncbi:MAG: DNA polymerase III subunit alpha [Elusimicrobia bacterium ADurb.Bin231]|nr:MAG: DNA polymerase III subunit alpha [Elusimicrobia bacterium ADurb.Bin231]